VKIATMYFRCGTFEFKVGGYQYKDQAYMRNWSGACHNKGSARMEPQRQRRKHEPS
jgi:hypothetical protein